MRLSSIQPQQATKPQMQSQQALPVPSLLPWHQHARRSYASGSIPHDRLDSLLGYLVEPVILMFSKRLFASISPVSLLTEIMTMCTKVGDSSFFPIYSAPLSTIAGLGKNTSVKTRCQGALRVIRGPEGFGRVRCARDKTICTSKPVVMNAQFLIFSSGLKILLDGEKTCSAKKPPSGRPTTVPM